MFKSVKKIKIYSSETGKIKVHVNLDKHTVWLNLNQIASLFDTDKSGISRHISNIYKTGELRKKPTVAKIATVQMEKNRQVKRNVIFYNLDLILSVGYRVNSQKATQFRIWATNILKKYITKGYVANQSRLEQLQQTIKLITSKSKNNLLKGHEQEIIDLIESYSSSFDLLKQYDNRNIKKPKLNSKTKYNLVSEDIQKIIQQLRSQFGSQTFLGQTNSDKINSILENINQTFDKKELYPSIEEKAANLLYMIIKDHPFIDGNKRVATASFLYFLSKNNYLFDTNNQPKFSKNNLAAVSLLIAISNPEEKDIMINLLINLIK